MRRKTEVPGLEVRLNSKSQSPSSSGTTTQGDLAKPIGLPSEEQRYRTLIEQLPAILYIAEYGPEGPCYFVSPKIEELLGFKPEDWMEGKGFWIGRMHPDDRERALAAEEEARQTGKNLCCEYRLQHSDGTYRWFRDDGVPLPGGPGRPPVLHGVLYDIHESKKTEIALRHAQARYRDVIERIPAAAYVADFDPDKPWQYISPQIEVLLGVSQKEWLGKAGMWIAHVHPDDRDLARSATAQARIQGGPFHMEYRMVARNGRVLWLQDEGSVARGSGSKPELIHGILTEITERKKAEQELRESEQLLRLALEASGTAAFDMDTLTGSLSWDSRGGQLFELPDHLNGKPFQELLYRIHPEDRGILVTTIQDSLSKGSAIRLEIRIVLDNGNVEWRSIHGKAIRDAGGELVRLVGIGQGISERKRAEEALRRSEERYRALFEDNIAALVLVTQDGRFLDCNRAFLQMHGYNSKAELQGLKGEDLYGDPKDRGKMLELLRAQGRIDNFEARHRRKDGTAFWALRSVCLLEDPNGGQPLLFGTALNISALKSAESALIESEEKLRESQDRLRHTLNHAPLVLFSLDRDGRFQLSEGRGLQALGLKPGQVVGHSIYEIYKDYPDILSNFRRALSGEEFTTVDQVSVASQSLTYETAWMPLRNAEGTVTGAAGVATDISARTRAELARRAADERMRLALEGLRMGSWELEPSTGLVAWDENLYQALQVNAPTLSRKFSDFLEIVHPEDRRRLIEELRRSETEQRPCAMEYRVVLPGGEVQWRSSFAQPLFDTQGKLLRFVGVNQDITERRKLEEQLRMAQKMEAIGQLAGGVAHDFNNLLTVIRANAEAMITDSGESPLSRSHAEAVMKAADRAAGITRQLLAFSRKQVLQPKTIELGSVVSDTAGLLRKLLGPAIKLELRLPADSLHVRVDASQLDQVVLNLVINARDAMPEGGTLTLSIDRTPKGSEGVRRFPQMPDANYVRLTVQDTGLGMDAATQARIFEPFFTTKALGKGTGLGLATVYGIVKQSEGWIWVDSAPEKGTCFEVFLPEVPAPLPAERTQPSRYGNLRGTETVLVVDDEEDILEIAVGFLREMGYRVLAASSAEQALQEISRHSGSLDLLITDALMPGMPGLQLAKRVRDLQPSTNVLYISGYAEQSGILTHLPCQGEDFLQKPFGLTELAAKIRELLSR